MATFKEWDRTAGTPTGEDITIRAEDVQDSKGVGVKDMRTPSRKIRNITSVKQAGKDWVFVDCPKGEFDDRLRDATARAPTSQEFPGGSEGLVSSPEPIDPIDFDR